MEAGAVIFVLLAFANSVVFCNDNVPVLMWNSHRSGSLSEPAVPALQQISVSGLQARYLDTFQPNNVILFLQDALSAEDLSSHSAEFKHLSSWLQSGRSLYLPNVVQPQQLIHDLVQQGYKMTKLMAGTAVAELKLDPSGKNIVLVKLPPSITNPSRSRALRKADEVIQSVLSKIGDMADFTVIYTASKNSVQEGSEKSHSMSEPEEHSRVARSLQQFNTDPPIPNLHNSSCIRIYFRNKMKISVTGPKGNFSEVPENTQNGEALSDCREGSNMHYIQLNFDKVSVGDTTFHKLKIAFYMERKKTFWRLFRATVKLTKDSLEDERELEMIKLSKQWIPVGKSYSCSVPLVFRERGNKTDLVQLVVNGVQMEAFVPTGKGSKFNPSWDCVGFFSIGIWAGLLATLLCVFIFTIGLVFLADIKTMDRFDDPKGKTIVVAQTAD